MPDRSDISPLSITDGKISKAAKIDPTKLAPATSGQVLIAGTDGKFRPGNLVTTSSGDTVAQGPAGPPGATGSQGATGATGATGANGTDASITEATVNAAGAVMHTDVPDSDTGFIKRTAAATYDVDTATYSVTGHTHDVMASGNSYAVGFVPIGSVTHSNTYLRKDGTWGTPVDTNDDTTANASITLSGDVTGTGTNAITCAVVNDSHTHHTQYFQESEFLNTSAGASDAGKPVKLDAEGHIDTSMINDGDISFVDLDDLPSTFAPSAHNHAASEITSGTLHADRYTNTTYTADDGISLAGTAFSVAAGTGLTQNGNGLELNLQGVADADVKVDDDYLVFLDGGATGAAKKESFADLATAMAGTGLTASSGELVVSTGTTGSTVATGDQGFDVHKYTRTITWGTDDSPHVTFTGDVATVTHGLGTAFVTISLIDVAGVVSEVGANGFVDLDAMLTILSVDDDKIKIGIASGATVSAGNVFKLTVIG
jgi:hypothetical protein